MNRYSMRLVLGTLLLTAGIAAQAGTTAAQAGTPPHGVNTAGQITEYTLTSGSGPTSITAGPDGNLWFTEKGTNHIGRISTDGVITEFSVPTASANPYTIAAGPDGNLWFTERGANKIGRITPSGQITEFLANVPIGTLYDNNYLDGITAGPNNSMWFAAGDYSNGYIGQINMNGTVTLFTLSGYHLPGKITTGNDGNLWFTDNNCTGNVICSGPNRAQNDETAALPKSNAPSGVTAACAGDACDHIGYISPSGAGGQFAVAGSLRALTGITKGPDGNLWFSDSSFQPGWITTGGAMTRFALPGSSSSFQAVTSGPDGNIWFADSGTNSLAYYDTAGTGLGKFSIPATGSSPTSLVTGPDNAIWFTENSTDKIGRLDMGYPTSTVTPTPTKTSSATTTPTPSVTRTATASATRTTTALPTNTPTVTSTTTGPTGTSTATSIATPPATASPTVTQPASGAWVARAPYPIPVSDPAVVSLGGALYSFGGNSTGGVTAAAYRYDPTANSWTMLAALPQARSGLSAVTDGTYIYLLNGSGFSTQVYRYDPAGNGYTALAPAPLGTYAQAAALAGGKIYRIGGQIQGGNTAGVDSYDLAGNSWSAGPTYPQAVYFLMTTALNGSVYGAGGAGESDVSKAYRLNPAGGSWDDAGAPDLPDARWAAASGVMGSKWVLAGGNVNGQPSSSALVWDGQAVDPWLPLPPMLVARARLGGAGSGTSFFAVGGQDSAGTPTTDVQEYSDPCPVVFADVHTSDYFYTPVQYLACHGIIGGYADGTFRPYNNTTRGQLTKIIVGAQGWAVDTTGGPHFSDVPPGSTFYTYIETAFAHGIIGGYSDGTFQPNNPVTRGQLSKIVVGARGWTTDTTGGPHFTDVAPGSTFYNVIETAVNHGIISGYSDGSFRPTNSATRGQISKIVYLALTGP